mgnify:CR=1 FL=1
MPKRLHPAPKGAGFRLFVHNNAERALRELIVQRKIIGGLRREKGARIMEVIASVIATTKIRQQPLFQTIKSYL